MASPTRATNLFRNSSPPDTTRCASHLAPPHLPFPAPLPLNISKKPSGLFFFGYPSDASPHPLIPLTMGKIPQNHRSQGNCSSDTLSASGARPSQHTRSRRIKVNVIAHRTPIRWIITLNRNRLVSSCEKMPAFSMPSIVARRVCALKPLHCRNQIHVACSSAGDSGYP